MKYELVIFDFDGTLADSFPFFISVFNELATQHRFKKIEPDQIADLRGYSARQMMAHVGMPRWRLPFVAQSFIKIMNSRPDIQVFEGARETIQHLVQRGVRLAIVTANSRDNVLRILGQEIFKNFEYVEAGASIFGKTSKISRILSATDIAASRAIYIGDQISDIEAARKATISCGAVSWGYATLASLKKYSPDHVFLQMEDLRSIAA